MPGTAYPAKRLRRALLGAVFGFGLVAGVPAGAAEWPLVLSTETLGALPPGAGMAFFIGTWDQTSARAAGGPMTVTETTIEYRESSLPTARPYKVLHTGRNYVLLVSLDDLGDGDIWTRYRLFAAQSHGGPARRTDNLRAYWCTEYDFRRPEPFYWPTAKLLAAFKTSRCLGRIEDDGTVSIGWGSSPFQRR